MIISKYLLKRFILVISRRHRYITRIFHASVNVLKELRPGTFITINGVTKMITEASPGGTLTEKVLLDKKK